MPKITPKKRTGETGAGAKKAGVKKAGDRHDLPALPPKLVALLESGPNPTAAAILVAAGELFAEHGPSKVSLRQIAERAGVNYGLIHHYFGTKEALLIAYFQPQAEHGLIFIDQTQRADDVTSSLFEAPAGRFAELLTWAVLDGTPPEPIFADSSALDAYTAVIERTWAAMGDEPPRHGAREVAGFLLFNIMLWDLYAPYMRALMNTPDTSLPELREKVEAILRDTVMKLGPGQSSRE